MELLAYLTRMCRIMSLRVKPRFRVGESGEFPEVPVPLKPLPPSGTATEAHGLPPQSGGEVKARPGVHRSNPRG